MTAPSTPECMKIVSRYATYANEDGAYDEVRVSVQSQTKRGRAPYGRRAPQAPED